MGSRSSSIATGGADRSGSSATWTFSFSASATAVPFLSAVEVPEAQHEHDHRPAESVEPHRLVHRDDRIMLPAETEAGNGRVLQRLARQIGRQRSRALGGEL